MRNNIDCMTFMTVNLNVDVFNEKERKAIQELSTKRLLARSLATALKEYLARVNPELATEPTKEDVLTLKTEGDIDTAIEKYLTLRPNLTRLETSYIKTGLIKQLDLRKEIQVIVRADQIFIIQ